MWLKNARHKKKQGALILVIMLFCILILNVAAGLMFSMKDPYETLRKETKAATAAVYPYQKDNTLIANMGDDFSKLKEVEKVILTKSLYVGDGVFHKNKKINAFLNIEEYDKEKHENVRMIQGKKEDIANLSNEECAIPECVAVDAGIKLGDTVKIKMNQEEKLYKLVATYCDIDSCSTAFDTNIILKEIPKNWNQSLKIYLYANDGYNGQDIENAYRANHNNEMLGSLYSTDNLIDNILTANNIVSAILLAIGMVMLVVSCFILNFIVRNTLLQDSKKIAIYKTMGYTNGDILKMYLSYYGFVTLIGGIVGTLISKPIADRVLESMFKNIGEKANCHVWLSGFGFSICAVVFVLGIVYLVMRKIKNIKPILALNGMEPENTKKRRLKGNSNMSFSSFGIAFRQFTRNKRGAVGVIVTAIVTVFAINFALVSYDLAKDMKNQNSFWLGIDESDVWSASDHGEYLEKIGKEIEKDSRVKKVVLGSLDDKVLTKWSKEHTSTAYSVYIYDDYKQVDLPMVEGRNPENGSEIAVSTLVAKEYGLEPGDYFDIKIKAAKEVHLLVTGTFQTYMQLGDTVRVTSACYTDNGFSVNKDKMSIWLNDPSEKETMIKEYTKQYGGANFYKRTEAFSSIMNMIKEPQEIAIPAVGLFVLIIGAVNIFCIVLLKNGKNRKQNSIYKCIGYSTGHLILANLWYVLAIAVISVAIAVPLMIVIYPKIMTVALMTFQLKKYPVVLIPSHLIIVNLAIIGIFCLFTVLSSLVLRKVNVRELVQE